jgi:hypothetical protein
MLAVTDDLARRAGHVGVGAAEERISMRHDRLLI